MESKTLTPRGLDWITAAPVTVTARRRIAATPDRIWEAIADHETWPQWFDAIDRVEPLEPAHGVGGRRRVHIRSITIDEEFLAWEPGARFAFYVTSLNAPGIRSIVEDVQLAPVGEAATEISYTQALDLAGARILGPVLRRALPRALDKALAGLAQRVGG